MVPDLCWTWPGHKTSGGYGQIRSVYKNVYTHRVAFEAVHGPIAAGLEIDHHCRNRLCCNPLHLEAVTTAENQRRGASPSVIARNMGVCMRGLHDVTDPANLYVSVSADGKRTARCKPCGRAWREARVTASPLPATERARRKGQRR